MEKQNDESLYEIIPPEPKIDGWLKVKPFIIPFRPPGCNEIALQANERALEEERVKNANIIVNYIQHKGYSFHINAMPGYEHIFGIVPPVESKRIAIPKHIMTSDPYADLRNRQIELRRDIPILYMLCGFAHEATHLDRYFADPQKIGKVIDKMVESKYLEQDTAIYFNQQDGTILPETMAEEVTVDTESFFLVNNLGCGIELENYCTYLGKGKVYQQLVYERIKKRLQVEKIKHLGRKQ